jgi:hypothetical protein
MKKEQKYRNSGWLKSRISESWSSWKCLAFRAEQSKLEVYRKTYAHPPLETQTQRSAVTDDHDILEQKPEVHP